MLGGSSAKSGCGHHRGIRFGSKPVRGLLSGASRGGAALRRAPGRRPPHRRGSDGGHLCGGDRGGGPTRAWLFGIARNVVLTEYRRRARFSRAIGRLGGHRVLEPDALEHAIERIDAERPARVLRTGIAGLTPVLRDVLELIAIDELSVTEAAAVLGISPNTARVRLHRARRQLGHANPVANPVEVSP